MEENILEKLLHERYSVKQMISYFIVGFRESTNKNKIDEIMTSITTIVVNIDKNKIVDLIDIKYIEKIDLYWNLTVEQVLSYAYIVFNILMKSNTNIELKDIISEFLIVVKLYSPDNAVDKVKKKMAEREGE